MLDDSSAGPVFFQPELEKALLGDWCWVDPSRPGSFGIRIGLISHGLNLGDRISSRLRDVTQFGCFVRKFNRWWSGHVWISWPK